MEKNDWCTSYSTTEAETIYTAGITPKIFGVMFDSNREGFEFLMRKIDSPTCSDANEPWDFYNWVGILPGYTLD